MVLEIEQASVDSLEGVLACACQSLNGIDGKPAIINSMDLANMEFDTLGFTGKWLELIGDPSPNFTGSTSLSFRQTRTTHCDRSHLV